MGQQAENKGTNITKGQLAEILNAYFKPTETTAIPDEVSSESGHDIELTTIDDKYKINLSQIYTGSFEIEQAKWSYNHDAQTVTNGTLTLNIGDYINDTETNVEGFDGKWRVLGEENGQLLLVTATCWAPFEGSSYPSGPYFPSLQLSGLDGWNNGIRKLNDIGASYADGVKFENGRSITIADIDKITGYNPNNTGVNDYEKIGNGRKFEEGKIAQYKNNVTYTVKNGKVCYKGTDAVISEVESDIYKTFKPIGENNNINNSFTIESNFYMYYPTTLSETKDNSASIGLSKESTAYDMLFKVQGPPYWTASRAVAGGTGRAQWYLFMVSNECIASGMVWTSENSDGEYTSSWGVRPVVSLKSNITPMFVSKDTTTNISTYKI